MRRCEASGKLNGFLSFWKHVMNTRRSFLAQSAVAASAAMASQAFAADEKKAPDEPAISIVDPHLHLWDLSRLRLPWITKESPLARSFVMKDYLSAIDGLNVVKAVYMEVDVEPAQQKAEADFVLDVCRQNNTPMKAAVISGRPASDEFRKYLESFQGNRHLKGVRQVLHTAATPAGFCLQQNFVRGIRILGEMGLSFDLCMRPANLGDAVKLVEACPGTRFILDHCGNGPVYARDRVQWQRDMERLARIDRVVCKISGVIVQAEGRRDWKAEDLAPVINHSLDTFGPDRVMFAGDWPVCTLAASYRQWVDALKSIVRERTREQQRKLFHDNAIRVYGI